MLKFFKFTIVIFFSFVFTNSAHSLAPSSYLIANEAFLSFDYETASKYFDKYNHNNFSSKELRKIIISSVNSGRLEQTRKIVEEAIKIDEISEDAWLVLLTLSKLNNNLDIFKQFESLKNKDSYKLIDYIFYDNGQLQKNNILIAENLFELIQSINSSELINNKNIDYYLFYLNLALSFNSNFDELIFFQAQIYQELKYFIKAETLYKKIKTKRPLYLEAQKNIVLIKKKLNKLDEAERLLINLINEYPDNNLLLIFLADFYRTNKQYDKSIKYYTQIIDEYSNDEQKWRMHYLRGICYERLNKWEKAESDLLEALKHEPEQPQVLNYLAYGWIEKNHYIEKSIEMLELAVKKNPQSHYILDSLAWAYYKNNNFVKAAEIMEKVIEIAPGEAISLDHLGDIYFSLGRKKEAYFMWLQALDLAEPEDDISESVKIKLDEYNAG